MFPIRIKACSESDLRMLGNLARNIQRVLPVTQADIDAAAALGEGWVVWKVIEVNDPIDNLRGGTQLVIKENSITPGQNVRRVLIVSGPGGETVVIGPGPSPLLLPDAIADSLSYVKAFGGTEQGVPDGYTQLEYIVFDSTQVIDTGFTPDNNSRIESKCYRTGEDCWFYGAGPSNPRITLYHSRTGTCRWGYQSRSNVGFVADTEYTIIEDKNGLIINGIDNPWTSGTTDDFTCDRSLTIGNNNGSTGTRYFAGNFYYMKIYDNGVLARDFVPCKNASDIVGLYDKVNGVFYTDTGLVAGPVVVPTPDTPMDIVSNNGVLKANTNLYWTEYNGYELSQVDGITLKENSNVNVSGMVDCRTIKSFKITTASLQGSFRIFKYRADNTFIGANSTANVGDIVTLEDNVGYFRIQYNFTNSGTGTQNILIYNSAYDLNGIYADGTVETIKDSLNNTATTEMLLKVGDYQDVQSILDGVVTRNVKAIVLTGTENWGLATAWGTHAFSLPRFDGGSGIVPLICSHNTDYAGSSIVALNNQCTMRGSSFILSNNDYTNTSATDFKQWLAAQYAAGTPVIVIYPLATPTTESVAGQTLQVQAGDNVLEITQASLSNLELEAEYETNA